MNSARHVLYNLSSLIDQMFIAVFGEFSQLFALARQELAIPGDRTLVLGLFYLYFDELRRGKEGNHVQ